MATFPTSKEGFTYSPGAGLQPGLATEGAIRPLTSFASASSARPFETIVIGAGYAGLTAARDLTLAGQKVLLLDARDRIGGRTWTSQVDGVRPAPLSSFEALLTRIPRTGEVRDGRHVGSLADGLRLEGGGASPPSPRSSSRPR